MKRDRLLHGRMPATLSLAGATSLLELGPIAAGLQADAGVGSILLAGLAYQVGNAVPGTGGKAAPWICSAMAVLGAAGLVLSPVATAPWLAAVAALSWALQTIRRNLTARAGEDLPTTAEKRTARVLGFVVATLAPIAIWLPLVTLAMLASVRFSAAVRPAFPQVQHEAAEAKIVRFAMVLHQAHYFSYCYAIPILVASPLTGGIHASGLWFACGWISYLSAEFMWRRFALIRVFVAGHGFVTLVLVLLAMASATPWLAILLWIATGFGGGTVYCLKRLHQLRGGTEARIEHAEDIGHLLGVAVALVGVQALHWEAATLPLVGAAWAIAAGATVLMLGRRKPRAGGTSDGNGGGDADQ